MVNATDNRVEATHLNASETECHALPCNIEFTGRAPVKVYFTPHSVKNRENESARIYSAQFRGRQLLAVDPQQNHQGVSMQGRLLEVDPCKPKTSEERIKVKGKFGSIFEWKHECEPAVLENSSANNSRVRTALDWCDVARAVSYFECCFPIIIIFLKPIPQIFPGFLNYLYRSFMIRFL
jgi:hypothetical protein